MPPIEKLILNGTQLIMNPAAGTPTVLSPYITNAAVQFRRASVQTGAHGDLADTQGKGPGQHQFVFAWRYPRALSLLLPFFLVELNLDDPTPFHLFAKPGVVGLDNHRAAFAVAITDIGQLGGERGATMDGNVTLPISGQVTVFDGTTTVVV